MQLDTIDLNIEELPQLFTITLGAETFNFRLYWEPVDDSYYLDCFDENMVEIVSSEKLVYGENVFEHIPDNRLPVVSFAPVDESGIEVLCTGENFNKTVFLSFPQDDSSDVTGVDTDDDDIDSNSEDDSEDEETDTSPIGDYGSDPLRSDD